MARTCQHCEDAKRTYRWEKLQPRFFGGRVSYACTYCDLVAEWPSKK